MKHVFSAALVAAVSLSLEMRIPANEPVLDGGKTNIARFDAVLLCRVMTTYRKELGYFPKGDHREIMKAVTSGNNPRRIIFFEAPKKRFNDNGEYMDPWGNPYRIGSVADGLPWAYSFGPNGIDEGGVEQSDDIASWR